MKIKSVFYIAAVAGLALQLSSCASSPTYVRAVNFQDAGAARMKKAGEYDEKAISLYTKAIDYYKIIIANNPASSGATEHLGRIYYNGPVPLRNYEEALKYLNKTIEIYEASKEFDASRVYDAISTIYYRLGDYSSALANYEMAKGGMAQMYWLGVGVEQNLPKAIELYKEASEGAMTIFRGEERIEVDYWANIYAISYQINELKKGNYDSKAIELFLAYLHSTTMGESKNTWMQMLTESADLDYTPAQIDLWIVYRDLEEPAKGMPYLQKALEANYVPAFFHMGDVYRAGLGRKIDYKEAQKWYEKAAMEGHPVAQNKLGVLYYDNKIKSEKGSSNVEMARYWWSISAEQGNFSAIKNLRWLEDNQVSSSGLENNQVSSSGLDATIQILNSLSTIINASAETYNTLNKSKMKSYAPPSNKTQQMGQGNSQTSRTDRTADDKSSYSNPAASTTSATSPTATKSEGKRMCPLRCNHGKCGRCHGVGKVKCSSCMGRGYTTTVAGGKPKCQTCGGDGLVKCHDCYGNGKCSRCHGKGEV